MDEEVYHDQMNKIELLLSQLTNVDIEKGNTEKLSSDDVRTVLRSIFPAIEDEALIAMVKAAHLELQSGEGPKEGAEGEEQLIEYKELFKEDDEGGTGPFLEEVVKHLQLEKMSFVDSIKEQLKDIK